MNIHGLDDQSLLLIFDRLSVENLLRAGRVCSRWNAIRGKAALSRKSLTLLIGPNALREIENSDIRTIPYYELLNKENHAQIALPDFNEVMNNTQSQLQINSMSSSFHVNLLSQLFANVQHFTISCLDTKSNVQLVNDLLVQWSAQLVTLKLYIYSHWTSVEYGLLRIEWAQNRQLLSTINSMGLLKVLHLDFCYQRELCDGELESEDVMFVKRLTQFHLGFFCPELLLKYLIDSLNVHGDKIDDIAIASYQEHEEYLHIKPEIAQRFSQLFIEIDTSPNIKHLSSHFTNLSILELTLKSYDLIIAPNIFHRSVATLKQLIYLRICGNEESLGKLMLHWTEQENIHALYGSDDYKSTSVQVFQLTIKDSNYGLRDHDDLGRLSLPHFYPQVRAFILERSHFTCDECEDAGLLYEQYCLKQMLTATKMDPNRVMIKTIEPNRKWSKEDLVIDYDNLTWVKKYDDEDADSDESDHDD